MALFKLLSGTHRMSGKKYIAGMVIESDLDLDTKHSNKFERVPEVADAIAEPEPNEPNETTADAPETNKLVKAGRRWKVVGPDGEPRHEGNLSKSDAEELKTSLDADG